MFEFGQKPPIVMCPGCKTQMKPVEYKPIRFSNGMVDVTYICETCQTPSVRTVRKSDK